MSFTAANYGFWEFWAPYDPADGYYGHQRVIFDGENKLIYIDPDTEVIDIRSDVYSNWKEWVQVRDNAKYEPAMRTTGGDPISGGINTGDIYFLINDWRIVVDHNLDIYGAIYSDNYASPYVREPGTNIVINRVSNLVQSIGTDEALQRTIDYGGKVFIDFSSIESGDKYPFGTWSRPVNNFSDAIAVSIRYGLDELFVRNGTGTLTGVAANYTISGVSKNCTVLIGTGAQISGCRFNNLTLAGNIGGNEIQAESCRLNEMINVNGSYTDCAFNASITLADNCNAIFHNCYSSIPGTTTPVLDFGSVVGYASVNIRSYSGGLTVIDSDAAGVTTTIEVEAGRVILEPTCTAGYASIRGVAQLIDNSAGMTVDTSALVERLVSTALAPSLAEINTTVDAIDANVVVVQEMIESIDLELDGIQGLTDAQSIMLLEMYELLGLDPTKPLIVSNSHREVVNTEIYQEIDTDNARTVVTRTPRPGP